jgi:hypothetical protein
MKNKNRIDWILIATLINMGAYASVSTLTTKFILDLGVTPYQLVNIAKLVLTITATRIAVKSKKINNLAVKNLKTFLTIENIISVICIAGTWVTDSAAIGAVAAILCTPMYCLEDVSINKLKVDHFKDDTERLKFENNRSMYTPIVQLVCGALGLLFVQFMTGKQAFCLLFIADMANNICYIRAYDQCYKK